MVGFNCTFAQSSGKQVKFQKLSILKYRTSTHLFNYGRYTMYNVQSEPEINGMNVVFVYPFTKNVVELSNLQMFLRAVF